MPIDDLAGVIETLAGRQSAIPEICCSAAVPTPPMYSSKPAHNPPTRRRCAYAPARPQFARRR